MQVAAAYAMVTTVFQILKKRQGVLMCLAL